MEYVNEDYKCVTGRRFSSQARLRQNSKLTTISSQVFLDLRRIPKEYSSFNLLTLGDFFNSEMIFSKAFPQMLGNG